MTYLGQLTGISDITFDPSYFGGGTHENRDGQELDVHVDFNKDAKTGMYRRLNLLIYLNTEWEDSWGGQIEIHSNPRDPFSNQVTSFSPIFNRCVIFETHETSWHGFPRITLPNEKKHLSRKSFSVYFYSIHPPECGDVPLHSTFYVQRWLSKSIQPGEILSQDAYREVVSLLRKRDLWIEYYQKKEIDFSREREQFQKTVAMMEVAQGPTLFGYASYSGKLQDWYYDGWCGPDLHFQLKAERPANEITLNAFIPIGTLDENILKIEIDGELRGQAIVPSGTVTPITLKINLKALETVSIRVIAKKSFIPLQMTGQGDDGRALSWMIKNMYTEHS